MKFHKCWVDWPTMERVIRSMRTIFFELDCHKPFFFFIFHCLFNWLHWDKDPCLKWAMEHSDTEFMSFKNNIRTTSIDWCEISTVLLDIRGQKVTSFTFSKRLQPNAHSLFIENIRSETRIPSGWCYLSNLCSREAIWVTWHVALVNVCCVCEANDKNLFHFAVVWLAVLLLLLPRERTGYRPTQTVFQFMNFDFVKIPFARRRYLFIYLYRLYESINGELLVFACSTIVETKCVCSNVEHDTIQYVLITRNETKREINIRPLCSLRVIYTMGRMGIIRTQRT